MLDNIKRLGDSVTLDQINKLKEALGDALYNLLENAFDAETEAEAEERVNAFVSVSKKSPMKILKSRKILEEEQRVIIMDLLKG